MKTLKKLTLKDLKAGFRVISDEELLLLKGGEGPSSTFQMSDGCIENYNGYAIYYPDSNPGCPIFLNGVNVKGESFLQPGDTAYQWNGTIYVGNDFTSFNVNDLAHEYGHWLQQSTMGSWDYIWQVAVPSMGTVNDPNHLSQSYEQDATKLGSNYIGSQY